MEQLLNGVYFAYIYVIYFNIRQL